MSIDKELLVPQTRSFAFLHFETHEDYVAGDDDIICGVIMKIKDAQERCEFAKSEICHEINPHFEYIKWVFCDMSYGERFYLFAIPVFIVMIATFIIVLIVNNYCSFAHNIISVGYVLRLEEHYVGVILLGTLHGLPNIVMYNLRSDLTREPKDESAFIAPNTVYGTTMISCLLAGILVVIYPLNVRPTTFFIDNFFFFVMLIFSHTILLSNKIHIAESIILILLYLIYIVCMSVEYYYRYRKDHPVDDTFSSSMLYVTNPMYNLSLAEEYEFDNSKSRNDQLFNQFLRSINPIQELNRRNIVNCRPLYLILDPLRIAIQLIVPTVNYTVRGHGWSKLLNCINLLLTPLMLIYLYNLSYIWCIALIAIGFLLALIVFLTSRTDHPPVYHAAFVFFGFIGNLTINTYITAELVSLYNTIGAITGMPKQGTKLLLIPWARLSSDMITNFILARSGYRVAAFASLINRPLFENFFYMGIGGLLMQIRQRATLIEVRFNALGETTLFFIYAYLCGRTIGIMLTRYQVRRSIGIFLIGVYSIYVHWILLTEIAVIHPLSPRHTAISDPNHQDVEWA